MWCDVMWCDVMWSLQSISTVKDAITKRHKPSLRWTSVMARTASRPRCSILCNTWTINNIWCRLHKLVSSTRRVWHSTQVNITYTEVGTRAQSVSSFCSITKPCHHNIKQRFPCRIIIKWKRNISEIQHHSMITCPMASGLGVCSCSAWLLWSAATTWRDEEEGYT